MFARVFLALPLLCGSAAVAQEATPVVPAAAEAAADTRIGAPWDAIVVPLIERRYKVEAIRFKARDESGVDWLGSDEVKVGTFDATGETVSDEIGDIDSGDTHAFDPAVSCIIGVQPGKVVLGESSACDPAGVPGPFSFRVELWEQDFEAFEFEDIFGDGTGFCSQPFPPEPGRHVGEGILHCDTDDFLGAMELFFPSPISRRPCRSSATASPRRWCSARARTVPAPAGRFPDYSFTYRTTRLPDVGRDFRSELAAAMDRTGIVAADERSRPAFGFSPRRRRARQNWNDRKPGSRTRRVPPPRSA